MKTTCHNLMLLAALALAPTVSVARAGALGFDVASDGMPKADIRAGVDRCESSQFIASLIEQSDEADHPLAVSLTAITPLEETSQPSQQGALLRGVEPGYSDPLLVNSELSASRIQNMQAAAENWRIQVDSVSNGQSAAIQVPIGCLSDVDGSHFTFGVNGSHADANQHDDALTMLSAVNQASSDDDADAFGRMCSLVNSKSQMSVENTTYAAWVTENTKGSADQLNFTYDSDKGKPFYFTYGTDDLSEKLVQLDPKGRASMRFGSGSLLDDLAAAGIDLDDFFSGSGLGSESLLTASGMSDLQAVPEPSSMLMMCFGMLFFGLNNRRQRRRARKLSMLGSGLIG